MVGSGVAELLREANTAGLSVSVEGDKLLVSGPTSAKSLGLRILARKLEVVAFLKWRLPAAYALAFPDSAPAADEEHDHIVACLERDGFVLLWSNVLADCIGIYRSEADRARIPALFVPYSEEEMRLLFENPPAGRSANYLRLLHATKKATGGRIAS